MSLKNCQSPHSNQLFNLPARVGLNPTPRITAEPTSFSLLENEKFIWRGADIFKPILNEFTCFISALRNLGYVLIITRARPLIFVGDCPSLNIVNTDM